MNYEELLAAKSDGRLNKTQLPIGEYYRTQVDGKFRGMVDIRPEMNESVVFSEALKTESERNKKLVNHHQLHFTTIEKSGEVRQLEVEPGVYISFQELLEETPAVVAQKNFIDTVLEGLVDITKYLLSHGSFYLGVNDQQELYGKDVDYVAPEVLQHGTVDGRCDVYSIGRFMEMLFRHADMPLEYRRAVKRATSEKPEDRYATPEDMLKAVQQHRSTLHSVVALLIAVAIAGFCIALYFDMMPETEQVEFVKPVPRQAIDDIIDDGFDPAEMGITNADSLSEEQQVTQRELDAKAEAIFRKNYEKEAERILGKIYNKEYMSNSEKIFLSKSKSVIEELVKRQQELGEEAGLTQQRAEKIAEEINDRISSAKTKALGGTNTRGIQK